MNGISRQHFTIQVTLIDLVHVHFLSFVVRPLNTSSRWRVITRNRKPDGGTITQVILSLNKALTECSSSNDDSTVPILERTGKDFAGTGCHFIYQYYQFTLFKQ